MFYRKSRIIRAIWLIDLGYVKLTSCRSCRILTEKVIVHRTRQRSKITKVGISAFKRFFLQGKYFFLAVKKRALEEGGYSGFFVAGVRIFTNEGVFGLVKRIFKFNIRYRKYNNTDYPEWIKENDSCGVKDVVTLAKSLSQESGSPLFLIVIYHSHASQASLKRTLYSITSQAYLKWEIHVVASSSEEFSAAAFAQVVEDLDHHHIYIHFNDLSANSWLRLVHESCHYIGFVRSGDELHFTALFNTAQYIMSHPEADMFYSDEDKLDASNNRVEPYFKCDFNYELMLSQNMVGDLTIYKSSLLAELGGPHEEYEGHQFYDLALRAYERLGEGKIIHIPKVLYHRSKDALAVDEDKSSYKETARRIVQTHLQRNNVAARIVDHPDFSCLNRVEFSLPSKKPLVEIIIPTRDRVDLMRQCIRSIIEKTTYSNFHITIIDNGSVDPDTLAQFETWRQDQRIGIIRDENVFNYSKLNNQAVRATHAEYICLLNNDVEVISGDWLKEMISHAIRADVGCVGARLWYPNDRLQHGGVILGVGGIANHAHRNICRHERGYFDRAVSLQALSAVTAACLVVRRSIYLDVGGMNEELQVAYNDIDFCLKVKAAGFRNVWTPFAELYHHESATRGYEDSPEKVKRFHHEVEFMKKRWGGALRADPYYSPNLTLIHEDFSFARRSRLDLENICLR